MELHRVECTVWENNRFQLFIVIFRILSHYFFPLSILTIWRRDFDVIAPHVQMLTFHNRILKSTDVSIHTKSDLWQHFTIIGLRKYLFDNTVAKHRQNTEKIKRKKYKENFKTFCIKPALCRSTKNNKIKLISGFLNYAVNSAQKSRYQDVCLSVYCIFRLVVGFNTREKIDEKMTHLVVQKAIDNRHQNTLQPKEVQRNVL